MHTSHAWIRPAVADLLVVMLNVTDCGEAMGSRRHGDNSNNCDGSPGAAPLSSFTVERLALGVRANRHGDEQ
jgi:hypothetical protein